MTLSDDVGIEGRRRDPITRWGAEAGSWNFKPRRRLEIFLTDSYIARHLDIWYKKSPRKGLFLFLCLFVASLSFAPLAELIEINLAFYQLAVFARPVVDSLAFAAGELDELFLCHNGRTIPPQC